MPAMFKKYWLTFFFCSEIIETLEDLLIVLKRENGIDSEDDCESDEIEIDVRRSHVLKDTLKIVLKEKFNPKKLLKVLIR